MSPEENHKLTHMIVIVDGKEEEREIDYAAMQSSSISILPDSMRRSPVSRRIPKLKPDEEVVWYADKTHPVILKTGRQETSQ